MMIWNDHHRYRNILRALYYVLLLENSHHHAAKAAYMTHSTGVCTVSGISYAPIVEQYLLDTCLPVRGSANKRMKYTAETSSSGVNIVLKNSVYLTKYNNCSASPVSAAQSVTTVVTDPYVCGLSGVQGAITTVAYTAPTNVYALTSLYTDVGSCVSGQNAYYQMYEDTTQSNICHYYSPTSEYLMVQCVQARVKNSQTVSVQPIFNFYGKTDATCKGGVVRTVVGTADGQYALSGCNVTGSAIPTTVSCPACSPSNPIACYYTTSAARGRDRTVAGRGPSVWGEPLVVVVALTGLVSWISF